MLTHLNKPYIVDIKLEMRGLIGSMSLHLHFLQVPWYHY